MRHHAAMKSGTLVSSADPLPIPASTLKNQDYGRLGEQLRQAPFPRSPIVMTDFNPKAITRPDARLMKYYLVTALLTGPLFPIVILPLYFKYETLKYRFDDSGISMSWGILFRKEIYLTYRRIQDIHLTRNLIQRWFGLATVAVQTASGNATAEMSIDGIIEADELRDFLYSRMRGRAVKAMGRPRPPRMQRTGSRRIEPVVLLREIRDALQSLATRGTGAMTTHVQRTGAWLYQGLWGILTRWFRVPAQPPTLPVAAGETANAFQPSAGFLRYLTFQFWLGVRVAVFVDLLILGWPSRSPSRLPASPAG